MNIKKTFKEQFTNNYRIKLELWGVTTGIFCIGLFTGLIMRITEQTYYLLLAGIVVGVLKLYMNKIFINYKNEIICAKRGIQCHSKHL